MEDDRLQQISEPLITNQGGQKVHDSARETVKSAAGAGKIGQLDGVEAQSSSNLILYALNKNEIKNVQSYEKVPPSGSNPSREERIKQASEIDKINEECMALQYKWRFPNNKKDSNQDSFREKLKDQNMKSLAELGIQHYEFPEDMHEFLNQENVSETKVEVYSVYQDDVFDEDTSYLFVQVCIQNKPQFRIYKMVCQNDEDFEITRSTHEMAWEELNGQRIVNGQPIDTYLDRDGISFILMLTKDQEEFKDYTLSGVAWCHFSFKNEQLKIKEYIEIDEKEDHKLAGLQISNHIDQSCVDPQEPKTRFLLTLMSTNRNLNCCHTFNIISLNGGKSKVMDTIQFDGLGKPLLITIDPLDAQAYPGQTNTHLVLRFQEDFQIAVVYEISKQFKVLNIYADQGQPQRDHFEKVTINILQKETYEYVQSKQVVKYQDQSEKSVFFRSRKSHIFLNQGKSANITNDVQDLKGYQLAKNIHSNLDNKGNTATLINQTYMLIMDEKEIKRVNLPGYETYTPNFITDGNYRSQMFYSQKQNNVVFQYDQGKPFGNLTHDQQEQADQFLIQTEENGVVDINQAIFHDTNLSQNQKQILYDNFTKDNVVSALGINKIEQMSDIFLPNQQVCVNGGVFGSLQQIQQQKGHVVTLKNGQLKVSGVEDIENGLILNHLNVKKPVGVSSPQLVLAYKTEPGLLKKYHEGVQANIHDFCESSQKEIHLLWLLILGKDKDGKPAIIAQQPLQTNFKTQGTEILPTSFLSEAVQGERYQIAQVSEVSTNNGSHDKNGYDKVDYALCETNKQGNTSLIHIFRCYTNADQTDAKIYRIGANIFSQNNQKKIPVELRLKSVIDENHIITGGQILSPDKNNDSGDDESFKYFQFLNPSDESTLIRDHLVNTTFKIFRNNFDEIEDVMIEVQLTETAQTNLDLLGDNEIWHILKDKLTFINETVPNELMSSHQAGEQIFANYCCINGLKPYQLMKNNGLKQMDEIARINDHACLFQVLLDRDDNDLTKLGIYNNSYILRKNVDGIAVFWDLFDKFDDLASRKLLIRMLQECENVSKARDVVMSNIFNISGNQQQMLFEWFFCQSEKSSDLNIKSISQFESLRDHDELVDSLNNICEEDQILIMEEAQKFLSLNSLEYHQTEMSIIDVTQSTITKFTKSVKNNDDEEIQIGNQEMAKLVLSMTLRSPEKIKDLTLIKRWTDFQYQKVKIYHIFHLIAFILTQVVPLVIILIREQYTKTKSIWISNTCYVTICISILASMGGQLIVIKNDISYFNDNWFRIEFARNIMGFFYILLRLILQENWYNYFDYGETTLCHLILAVLTCLRTFYIARVFIPLALKVANIMKTCVDTFTYGSLLVIWINLMILLQEIIGNSYEDEAIDSKHPYIKAVIINLRLSVGDIQEAKITKGFCQINAKTQEECDYAIQDIYTFFMWAQLIFQIYFTFLIMVNFVDAIFQSIYWQCQGANELLEYKIKSELILFYYSFENNLSKSLKLKKKASSKLVVFQQIKEEQTKTPAVEETIQAIKSHMNQVTDTLKSLIQDNSTTTSSSTASLSRDIKTLTSQVQSIQQQLHASTNEKESSTKQEIAQMRTEIREIMDLLVQH